MHFICRLGNDSQVAARKFQEVKREGKMKKFEFKGDVKGGLKAWREEVDPEFPDY